MKTKMKLLSQTPVVGKWKRIRKVFDANNGVSVTLITQTTSKIDNAFINFGTSPFDPKLLYEVFHLDQFNCYPYCIQCSPSDATAVKAYAKLLGIEARVLVNPTVTEMMYAAAAAKGASKGFNGSKSTSLDKVMLGWVKDEVVLPIFKNIKVFRPTEKKSGNEDIRMETNGQSFFHQENKSISTEQNIIERFHMVAGKGLTTGGGLVDLLVSFEGYNIKFLDLLKTKAHAHIADAYAEFSVAEQTQLFGEKKRARKKTFENKHVMYPVDVSDPSKGLRQGELLRDFYTRKVQEVV